MVLGGFMFKENQHGIHFLDASSGESTYVNALFGWLWLVLRRNNMGNPRFSWL